MTEKIYITWEEFHQDVKSLATKIQAQGKFEQIVAVCRGGLIPAGILAYELGIRNCGCLNVSSYDGETAREDCRIAPEAEALKFDSHTLIIDDLADSGRTLRALQQLYPQAATACVYAKPNGKDICPIYARELPDKWVVFPWD